MNHQNQRQQINYSKIELIEKLCNTSYTKIEKKRIFLNKNGRKCQTCHKLKIKKKLSPFDFSNKHQKYICICHIQESNSIYDESSNNAPNNEDNIDSIQSNQINDNDMDIDNDGLENEEKEEGVKTKKVKKVKKMKKMK